MADSRDVWATVTIPVALVEEAVTANQRLHWAEKGERTAALRKKSKTLHRDVDPMRSARLVVTVRWPDHRRRDVANLAPTVKALVDGAVDAGVLPDDDDNHLVGPDMRVLPRTSGTAGVVILAMQWLGPRR